MAKNLEIATKILNAAISLWSEKGYRNMTMRELAKRASMGTSSLYSYFQSKEEIVLFLYEKLNLQARETFTKSVDSQLDPFTKLIEFMRIKLGLLTAHRSALPALLREAIDPESTLSPLSGDSLPVLSQNLSFFKDFFQGDGVVSSSTMSGATKARLLWVVHIGLLVFWLHDRSEGQKNTHELLNQLATLTPAQRSMFDMVSSIPEAHKILELLMTVVAVDQETSTVSEKPDGSSVPARQVDVVVMGAGPIGCLFAAFLKQRRPQTRILMIEKSQEPVHKIGESTLSGFCKALRTVGLRQDAMERMFYPKNGLGFFHVTEGTKHIQDSYEYILETFDETFQVERRVLDSMLIQQVRRLGIDVIQGAVVDLKKSTLSTGKNVVVYDIGGKNFSVGSSWLVDASGPAHGIANHYKLWTSEGLPFQTSSVWSYWKNVKPLADYSGWKNVAKFPRDQYTQHFCFREGWCWFIPLVSWQDSPSANLSRVFDRLHDSTRTPSRVQIEQEYGCPTRELLSFGLTLRSDRDERLREDPSTAFDYYREKYPVLQQILHGATLVDPYAGEPSLQSRRSMRGYARRVVGDGWLAIGDAAFFVDPLISPGLTGGTATAFRAAVGVGEWLDKGAVYEEQLSDYQDFVHELHAALERDNQLVYMSFNHPRLMALIQRFQEVDARRHFLIHQNDQYSNEDTNVWGILSPAYQEMQKELWNRMRDAESKQSLACSEQSVNDYNALVNELDAVLKSYLQANLSLTPYAMENVS
jgi:flavin-dependent dehydrogenase/AcrR family transcriptional regulator